MADFVKSFRDGVLTFVDASGTPKTIIITDAEGDFKATMARNVVEMKNRGVLLDIKKGDVAPTEWSLSIKFRGLEGAPLASSTIATQLLVAATTIELADASAFATSGTAVIGPANGSGADQEEEVVAWGSKASDTLLGGIRGHDGSTAKQWEIGAPIREIDFAKRTIAEWMFRRGGYAGLVGTRDATSDVFAFRLWFSVLDKDDNIESIFDLDDAYALKVDVVEGADYNTLVASGRSFQDYPVDITP